MTAVRQTVGDDRGFTIVELLMAMVLGSIVLTALMTVFITGLNVSARVGDRAEAGSRARTTMDRMVQLLQAQTCVNGGSPISVATPTSVTFTALLNGVDDPPTQFSLAWSSTTNSITETDYPATVQSDGTVTGFSTVPSSSRVLASNIVPPSGTTTIFSYYKFTAAGEVTTPLATVSAADSALVVRVGVAFDAVPDRTHVDDARSAAIVGDATVASADASQPTKGPNC